MEILNRNKRRSALWRITALLGAILAVLFTVLVSMNQAYKGQGSGEVEGLNKKMALLTDSLTKQIRKLEKDTTLFSQNLRTSKAQIKQNSENTIQAWEQEKKTLKNDIIDLKEKIKIKQTKIEDNIQEIVTLKAILKTKCDC